MNLGRRKDLMSCETVTERKVGSDFSNVKAQGWAEKLNSLKEL